ncbi:unnamed protein product [Caretta caretta]
MATESSRMASPKVYAEPCLVFTRKTLLSFGITYLSCLTILLGDAFFPAAENSSDSSAIFKLRGAIMTEEYLQSCVWNESKADPVANPMPVPEDVPQGEPQNLDDGIGMEDVDVVEAPGGQANPMVCSFSGGTCRNDGCVVFHVQANPMPVPEDVPQGEPQNLDDGIGMEDVDVVEAPGGQSSPMVCSFSSGTCRNDRCVGKEVTSGMCYPGVVCCIRPPVPSPFPRMCPKTWMLRRMMGLEWKMVTLPKQILMFRSAPFSACVLVVFADRFDAIGMKGP